MPAPFSQLLSFRRPVTPVHKVHGNRGPDIDNGLEQNLVGAQTAVLYSKEAKTSTGLQSANGRNLAAVER